MRCYYEVCTTDKCYIHGRPDVGASCRYVPESVAPCPGIGEANALAPVQVLGIAQSADNAAIKKAYRLQALQWHPGLPPFLYACRASATAVMADGAAQVTGLPFDAQTRTSTGWRRLTTSSRRYRMHMRC
jgi:DnaJ domain